MSSILYFAGTDFYCPDNHHIGHFIRHQVSEGNMEPEAIEVEPNQGPDAGYAINLFY